MSLSYRKTIKVGPFRITLGKSGAAVSAGPKHARVSAHTDGSKGASVGAGGLSWRKRRRRS